VASKASPASTPKVPTRFGMQCLPPNG
jgi:hypothetical protein